MPPNLSNIDLFKIISWHAVYDFCNKVINDSTALLMTKMSWCTYFGIIVHMIC